MTELRTWHEILKSNEKIQELRREPQGAIGRFGVCEGIFYRST